MPVTRQRSRRACRPCQQRKRKCDGQEPCGTCESYGYQCKFTVKDASISDNGRLVNRSRNSECRSGNQVLLNAVEPPNEQHPQAMLELSKSRYVNASSEVAFPMMVARDLDPRVPIRLHSYAWNCGIREEPTFDSMESMSNILTWDDLLKYAANYFQRVNPVFGLLEASAFNLQAPLVWNNSSQFSGLDALVCGVCALGSFFSGVDASPALEEVLVRRAKDIMESQDSVRPVSSIHVSAWMLRSIYLRCTTRPHASWMASCHAVHLSEAVGLHRELASITLTSSSGIISTMTAEDLELRRRTFWLVWSWNRFLSIVYGRSPTTLDGCNCLDPSSGHGHGQVLAFVRLVKELVECLDGSSDRATEIHQEWVGERDEPEPLIMFRASACFCLYRQDRASRKRSTTTQDLLLIGLGRKAIQAAQSLSLQNQPWWDTVSVPFQLICILIDMDNKEALNLLTVTITALEEVVNSLRSHMAYEALNTARIMINLLASRKRAEIRLLESHVDVSQEAQSSIKTPQYGDYTVDILQADEQWLDPHYWSFEGVSL